MIDPIAALDGLQKAIGMVKKASKVANDLGGLAPMIGKMFDAKSQATKAMLEAKRSKNKSNLGTALQIEMALDQARVFEEDLKMLFMQAGKIDVWNKAKAKQAEMDLEDAKEIAALKAAEKKQKEEEEEQMTYLIAGLAIVFFVALVAFGISEIGDMCAKARCGR
jgi:DNA helicase TIP49 (TBP-interacting protein)